MNKKIMSVASLVFALVFVGIFLFMWSTSKDAISIGTDNLDSMHRADVPFDISLFSDKTVTGSTLLRLEENIEKSTSTYKTPISFVDESGAELVPDSGEVYRTRINYSNAGTLNTNGVLKSIECIKK